MSWRNYSRYFPTSTPRRVEGGIKAHSQRGSFGQRWWAKRWVNILEQTEMAQRLKVPLSWLYSRTRIRGGDFPVIRVGKYCRFNPDAVMAWITKQSGGAESL